MNKKEEVFDQPDEQNSAIKWLAGFQGMAAVLATALGVAGQLTELPCEGGGHDLIELGPLFVGLQVVFMFVALGYLVWAFKAKRVGVILVVLVTFSLMFQGFECYAGVEDLRYNLTHTFRTGCWTF